jgi:hypothetical protein
VLLLVVIGCATAIIISAVSMISGAVNMVHRRRTQAELKRDMLERGMSAEEITSVIESAPAGDAASRTTAIWRKGQAQ